MNEKKNRDMYKHALFVGNIKQPSRARDLYGVFMMYGLGTNFHICFPTKKNPRFYKVTCKTKHFADVAIKHLHNKHMFRGHYLYVCYWKEAIGYLTCQNPMLYESDLPDDLLSSKGDLKMDITEKKEEEILPKIDDKLLWSKEYGYHKKKTVTLIETYDLVPSGEFVVL